MLLQVQLKAQGATARDPHWPKSELEQRCWQKKERLEAGYFLHVDKAVCEHNLTLQ